MNSVYNNHSDRLCIIVLGYILRMPLGGLAWHYLQYVMGLVRLGHEVYYIEDSCFFEEDEYGWFYDPIRDVMDPVPGYGLKFTAKIFDWVGLGNCWGYYNLQESCWKGPCADRIHEVFARAELLLNVSGANPLRSCLMQIPVRVFIDTDPVFTQTRILANSTRRNLALQHTVFFSFGENINSPRSSIPDDGIPWQTTRQPIALEAWPVIPGSPSGKFTTVMAWKSYKSGEQYKGIRYGMKAESFIDYMNLPDINGQQIELALFKSIAPREKLLEKGWIVRDGEMLTKDPWSYQHYLQQSKAEFSVAKQGYVVTNSGWFSERSACYLASGRPVVVQDTGFSKWLKTGAGVIAFSNLDEALAGIEKINSRYEFHCKAARAIAEKYFDSNKVLSHLIQLSMETV